MGSRAMRGVSLPSLLMLGLFMAALSPSTAFATTVNANCISPDPVVFTTMGSTPIITVNDADQSGSIPATTMIRAFTR